MTTAGCSRSGGGGRRPGPAATATSAAELGGLDALVAAARKEGELNVIGLPPEWVNYGEIISAFTRRYGIRVNSRLPDGTSQQEIDEATRLRGDPRAPDVFDLGGAVAAANVQRFARYRVAGWAGIPATLKDPGGAWVNDYGGYMSIGYNPDLVPEPRNLNDLFRPAYRNGVALAGDPARATAALNAVMAVSVALGDSPDEIARGVDFFGRLVRAGNFLRLNPTADMIRAGQVTVIIDWEYLNAGRARALGAQTRWRTVIPAQVTLGSYYVQAINADAPHPAAARLWQEFLYSDEGQNIWLRAGVRPVRLEAMRAAGTVDRAADAALPRATASPVFITPDQTATARTTVGPRWHEVMGPPELPPPPGASGPPAPRPSGPAPGGAPPPGPGAPPPGPGDPSAPGPGDPPPGSPDGRSMGSVTDTVATGGAPQPPDDSASGAPQPPDDSASGATAATVARLRPWPG